MASASPQLEQWPQADEAWAICLRGADEEDTVVRTREMAEAWAVASQVLDVGDKIGARMAFRDVYNRLAESAKAENRNPVWEISLGYDAQLRERRVSEAVSLGRLPASSLQIPHIRPEPSGGIVGLIAGAVLVSSGDDEAAECARNALEQLKKLKAALDRPYDETAKAKAARLERERFAAKKQREMERFAAYVAENYAPPDNVVSMLGVADEGSAHG